MVHSLLSLDSIATHCGVSLLELHQFIRRRDWYYRYFRVPKKNSGYRLIQAPCRRLKTVQRWIASTLLADVPLHQCCTGYRKGYSIVTNATPHTGAEFVFNADIACFFPSISEGRVQQVFRSLGFSAKMSRLLAALTTVNGALPQGAPTSPMLANLCCRRLDERLHSFAEQHGWSYTRYCDDITISGSGDFRRKRSTVFDIIISEGFEINHDKVRYAGKGHRQEVTGLVVNEFVNVPRQKRRLIRAMLHRQRTASQSASAESCPRLDGLLAFLKMVSTARQNHVAASAAREPAWERRLPTGMLC